MLKFKEDGCEISDLMFSRETSKYLNEYTFDQYNNHRIIEEWDELIPGNRPHAQYCDPIFNVVHTMILPKIESITGLNLFPTYNHYRIYEPGNSLQRHVDRRGCEISLSVFISSQYKPDKSYRWNLFAETLSGKMVEVEQKPGECLIYRGYDIPHWRNEFVGDVGSYHTQVFFHFVDKNGPDYPELKYDGRQGLGFPHPSKNNS